MEDEQSLRHTRWECKYHIVWIPKYRRKTLYGQLSVTGVFNSQGKGGIKLVVIGGIKSSAYSSSGSRVSRISFI